MPVLRIYDDENAPKETLYINRMYIHGFTNLSSDLQRLYCNFNYLRCIPPLPTSLVILELKGNLLSRVDVLPPALKWLDISNNLMLHICALPHTLERLIATNNMLTELPAFPESLSVARLSGNNLVSIPDVENTKILWDFNADFMGKRVECKSHCIGMRKSFLMVLRIIRGLDKCQMPQELTRLLVLTFWGRSGFLELVGWMSTKTLHE